MRARTLAPGVIRLCPAFSSENGRNALPGVFPTSFSFENAGCLIGTNGVTGSIFFKGACLLPGTSSLDVLSGLLYIPNTSANASFVLIVTVGSAPPPYALLRRMLIRVDLRSSSLKSTGCDEDDPGDMNIGISEDGGGPHFFPSRPIDRALASCILYSTPSSVKRSFISNFSFSGRFPGGGGASMRAYRWAAVELNVTTFEDALVVVTDDEELVLTSDRLDEADAF